MWGDHLLLGFLDHHLEIIIVGVWGLGSWGGVFSLNHLALNTLVETHRLEHFKSVFVSCTHYLPPESSGPWVINGVGLLKVALTII